MSEPAKVYLCGPINGRTDAECTSWRDEARRLWANPVLDPMARDYRGREAENVRAIVEGDKADIDACDAVIVYFDRPSVGTAMEVLYARERGKRVVVVNASRGPLSPWLSYHSDLVVPTVREAVVALRGPVR